MSNMDMLKKILKEIVRWILIVILAGFIIWMTSSIYKLIRKRFKGR